MHTCDFLDQGHEILSLKIYTASFTLFYVTVNVYAVTYKTFHETIKGCLKGHEMLTSCHSNHSSAHKLKRMPLEMIFTLMILVDVCYYFPSFFPTVEYFWLDKF